VTDPGSFGQQAGEGAVSFRCAACGEMAAVAKTLPAGRQADMEPPLGPQSQDRDGIVVDYFGGTAWKHAEAPPTRPSARSSAARPPTPPRCGGSTGN
jgi:hypothetical protein